MTTSSQQPNYSTILGSDLTTDDIITISSGTSPYYSTDHDFISNIGTITLTGSSGTTYSIPSLSGDTISFPDSISTIESYLPKEFVNAFPNWDKVEKMRKEYPALDIALKKFQEVYTMVEDDWQAQKGQKYVP